MPSFVIIAIVCALAVGQDPAVAPLDQSLLRVLLAFGTILVSCLMARVTVMACLDHSPTLGSPNHNVATRRSRWERWHLAVWLMMSTFLLFGVGWGTVVRTNWGLKSTILLDELVILLPLICPWLISWTYFYDLDARPSAKTTHLRRRWRYSLQHARMVFGLGLLPVLLVSLISDVARFLSPEWIDKPVPSSVFAVPMVLLVIAYPWILRRIWKTSKLPVGPIRTSLEQFVTCSGFRLREMYLWHTGGETMNAAVTGIIPRMRYLFFTDRLLEELPKDEILAAMAHELGHLRHRHLVVRIAALFLPVTSIIAIAGLAEWIWGPETFAEPTIENSLMTGLPTLAPEIFAVATAGIAILYLWQIIGAYSRRLELQADLAAWELLDQHFGCRQQAATTYTSMLRRVSGSETGGGWLHPPIATRLELIKRAATQASSSHSYVMKWSRDLRFIEFIIFVTTAISIGFMIFGR